MHLYTSEELARLLEPCTVVTLAGSNVTAVEGDAAFDNVVAADPGAWQTVVEVERRLCREPGLVDTGSHLIVVAQSPG